MTGARIHFVARSANAKAGPIPVTYSERSTCPPSCPHYGTSCYAEAGFHTRMQWDKVPQRGGTLADLCERIRALPAGQVWRFNVAGDLPGTGEAVAPAALDAIVRANRDANARGFTYTHKKRAQALRAAARATRHGFTINISADTLAEADTLADTGAWPIVALVPADAPAHFQTPAGRRGIVCLAQSRNDGVTCATCALCASATRTVIVGFRAHGTRARTADAIARGAQ